jgi:tetratricopeptide (TPR) repeat protein
MSQDTNLRRQKLEAFVASHPDDAFGRYGLAMECAREGDNEAALNHFRKLLDTHPNYVTGYFQYGQLLARLARDDEAREALTEGIAAASRQGDTHAATEMQAALDALH